MNLAFLGIYREIGFDLGTAMTAVAMGESVQFNEPSVVAVDSNTKKVIAVGDSADDMLGRTPDNITAICPIKNGVIADFEASASMIKAFLKKASGKMPVIRPRIAVCVPGSITDVERRAAIEAFTLAGAGNVYLIEEVTAAAIGAGLPIMSPQGSMIVNIGAGTTEVAVISLGGIVAARSIRTGSAAMDNSIISYLRHQYSVTIGEKTAEEIKKEIGSASVQSNETSYDVRGRETATGLPKNVRVSPHEIRQAIAPMVDEIVAAVLDTLEETPPELAADVLTSGITLAGGGALLKGMGDVIETATGIKTKLAKNPHECSAVGAYTALGEPAVLRRCEVGRVRR